MPIPVAVINESTVLTDDQVQTFMQALQIQMSEHLAPIWGVDATLTFVPSGGTPADGSYWLVVLDDSDQAGYLGYHDLTNEGLPIGKVFAATDQYYGYSESVTMSHELIEMLVNPWIMETVLFETAHTNYRYERLYALEICDPTQFDDDGYIITIGEGDDAVDVLVSNFVYPAWYKDGLGSQYDYNGLCSTPRELRPGGFATVINFITVTYWTNIYGSKISANNKKIKHGGKPVNSDLRVAKIGSDIATWTKSTKKFK